MNIRSLGSDSGSATIKCNFCFLTFLLFKNAYYARNLEKGKLWQQKAGRSVGKKGTLWRRPKKETVWYGLIWSKYIMWMCDDIAMQFITLYISVTLIRMNVVGKAGGTKIDDNRNLVPRTDTVEGENWLLRAVLWHECSLSISKWEKEKLWWLDTIWLIYVLMQTDSR